MLRPLAWTLSLLASLVALGVIAAHMSLYRVSYLVVIAAVLYHGFYGLDTLLREYWPGRRAGRVIGGACTAAGLSLFGLALATALTT